MSGKIDIVKGRIEEAAGSLVGSDRLRNKGKNDQAAGAAKKTAGRIIDQAEKRAKK